VKENEIGTNPRDADSSRQEARKEGEADGRRNYPPQDPNGNKAADYAGRTTRREADATDAITKAEHVNTTRVDDDKKLGAARAETGKRTALTADARGAAEDALADQRAYEQNTPTTAKAQFWPKSVVFALLVLLAAGSGAAVTAALLQVTTDQEWLTYIIGGSVAIATVAGGAALGALLRRRDLDAVQPGQFASKSNYATAVLLLGVLGVLALALGVAGLRHAASVADARRQADANKITLFLPGQGTKADNAPAPTGPGGVDWKTWLAFEFGVAAAATAIEFQAADARVIRSRHLSRDVKATNKKWRNEHAGLSAAVAVQEAVLSTRADHDAAVALIGNGQRAFGDVLVGDYRHGNLSQRGQAGDPFEELTSHARLPLDEQIDTSPGRDLLTLTSPDATDPKKLTSLIATNRDLLLLQDAYEELGRHPHRPARAEGEPWLAGADTLIDPATQALSGASFSDDKKPDAEELLRDQGAEATVLAERFAKPGPTKLPRAEVPGTNGNGSES